MSREIWILTDEEVERIADAVVRKLKEKADDDSDYELVPYTGKVYVRRRREITNDV